MSFSNAELEANYCRLGFVPDGQRLKLKVDHVDLVAVEHPLDGVAVFFSCFRPDTATQFDITLPVICSFHLIAGMIYANIAKILPEDAPAWKRHFQKLKIPLFQ
jgi:hypothetical protein